MHATRDTNHVINRQLVGGRVMRGVGRLVAEGEDEMLASRVAREKKVVSGERGVI
jgi:hypothetical protein